jgi:thiamine transporter ThiT
MAEDILAEETPSGEEVEARKNARGFAFGALLEALGAIFLANGRNPVLRYILACAALGFAWAAIYSFTQTTKARREWWEASITGPAVILRGWTWRVVRPLLKLTAWAVALSLFVWGATSVYEAASVKGILAVAVVLLLVLVARR